MFNLQEFITSMNEIGMTVIVVEKPEDLPRAAALSVIGNRYERKTPPTDKGCLADEP